MRKNVGCMWEWAIPPSMDWNGAWHGFTIGYSFGSL